MGQTSMSGMQTVVMDQRSRISFPAAYRAAIGELLYVSPDPRYRGFLVVRSEEGYDKECARIYQEILEQTNDAEEADDEARDFMKDTETITPDKNGRITLPAKLIQYAGLNAKVVVVGVGDHAELWDEAKLAEYEEQRRAIKAARRAKKDAEKAARLQRGEV